jgi:hypothetical protein
MLATLPDTAHTRPSPNLTLSEEKELGLAAPDKLKQFFREHYSYLGQGGCVVVCFRLCIVLGVRAGLNSLRNRL